jgi:hypothetical protein
MAPIFVRNAPQLNSKKCKKKGRDFCKTFAFIPAAAGLK